jgi:hypothetical protein
MPVRGECNIFVAFFAGIRLEGRLQALQMPVYSPNHILIDTPLDTFIFIIYQSINQFFVFMYHILWGFVWSVHFLWGFVSDRSIVGYFIKRLLTTSTYPIPRSLTVAHSGRAEVVAERAIVRPDVGATEAVLDAPEWAASEEPFLKRNKETIHKEGQNKHKKKHFQK